MNNKIMLTNDNSIKKINFIYFILLTLLILFGFYKNGIIPYYHGYINILEMFKPIVLPYLFYYVTSFIVYVKTKRKNASYYSLLPTSGLIVGMLLPISFNFFLLLIIYIITTFVYVFYIENKISINFIMYSICIILLCSMAIYQNFDITSLFMNKYEYNVKIDSNISKKILGFNVSGISSSNVVLSVIIAFLLYFLTIYKYNISIYSIMSFIVVALPFSLLFKYDIYGMFNSYVLFMLIFGVNEIKTSSYTNLGEVVSGILLGILIFINSFISIPFSVIISSLILSLITPILNKLCRKVI